MALALLHEHPAVCARDRCDPLLPPEYRSERERAEEDR